MATLQAQGEFLSSVFWEPTWCQGSPGCVSQWLCLIPCSQHWLPAVCAALPPLRPQFGIWCAETETGAVTSAGISCQDLLATQQEEVAIPGFRAQAPHQPLWHGGSALAEGGEPGG